MRNVMPLLLIVGLVGCDAHPASDPVAKQDTGNVTAGQQTGQPPVTEKAVAPPAAEQPAQAPVDPEAEARKPTEISVSSVLRIGSLEEIALYLRGQSHWAPLIRRAKRVVAVQGSLPPGLVLDVITKRIFLNRDRGSGGEGKYEIRIFVVYDDETSFKTEQRKVWVFTMVAGDQSQAKPQLDSSTATPTSQSRPSSSKKLFDNAIKTQAILGNRTQRLAKGFQDFDNAASEAARKRFKKALEEITFATSIAQTRQLTPPFAGWMVMNKLYDLFKQEGPNGLEPANIQEVLAAPLVVSKGKRAEMTFVGKARTDAIQQFLKFYGEMSAASNTPGGGGTGVSYTWLWKETQYRLREGPISLRTDTPGRVASNQPPGQGSGQGFPGSKKNKADPRKPNPGDQPRFCNECEGDGVAVCGCLTGFVNRSLCNQCLGLAKNACTKCKDGGDIRAKLNPNDITNMGKLAGNLKYVVGEISTNIAGNLQDARVYFDKTTSGSTKSFLAERKNRRLVTIGNLNGQGNRIKGQMISIIIERNKIIVQNINEPDRSRKTEFMKSCRKRVFASRNFINGLYIQK